MIHESPNTSLTKRSQGATAHGRSHEMHDRAVLEKGGQARTARWFLERIVGIDGHESELLKGEGGGIGLGLLLVITGHGRLIGLSVHDDLEDVLFLVGRPDLEGLHKIWLSPPSFR